MPSSRRPQSSLPPSPQNNASPTTSPRRIPGDLRSLIARPSVGFFKTTADGRIIKANRILAEFLGFGDPSALKDRNLHDFYAAPHERTKLLEKAESSPEAFGDLEIRRADGRSLWVREFPRPLRGPRGSIAGYEGIWYDITFSRRTEEELRYRMDMQNIIARISSRFISLPTEDIDEGIQQALEEIGNFTDSDRSYIFLWTEEGVRAECAYEWCRPGIPSTREGLKNLPVENFPWWMERLSRLEIIHIPRVADLPPEAGPEKEIMMATGTRSTIAVPMVLGTSLRGFLGFDAVSQDKVWTDDAIALLRIISQTMVNALERKRFETALRESEKKYRSLVDKSLLGIYITQGHILRFCNKYFAEMFGYSGPEELTGIHVRNLVAAESWESVDLEVGTRESSQKELSQYELKAVRRDGSLFDAEVLGSRIMFEGRPAIQGMITDITERKKSERLRDCLFRISEASAAAATLDELFRSIHLNIAELMPAKNFYIALYDPVLEEVHFPYFVDEFDEAPARKKPGKGLTEYVLCTGEPLLASPDVFDELERKGEVESIGTPSIDWLGVPLKMEGETRGVLVVQSYTPGVRYGEAEKAILKFVSDQVAQAIARKQAESTLQERERFLSSIFDSIQDGLSVLDLDLTILRVNRTMEEWYRHSSPLVGKKCYEAYHLRSTECDACPTRITLNSGKAAYEVVPKVGPRGERAGWLGLFSFPLLDQVTGRMNGVIEYVRDISEQKRAEEALLSSLQEKEVLLREVHHRVKNNMQVISSLLSLQSGLMKDPEAAELFKDGQRRIRSMALVHERLYQSADLSRIEFSEYLRHLAVHLFNFFRVDPSLIGMKVEAQEMFLNVNTAIPCGLIINELLSNTLKHAFPDGRRGEVLVSLSRQGDGGFLLRVKDDGIGFPAGHDLRKPTGLGMEIVTMLVSQLDGTIELVREAGTEFRVTFKEAAGRPLV